MIHQFRSTADLPSVSDDSCDGDLVCAVLAEDCVLDYMGCCTDPATGRDFIPATNVVLRGRAAWRSDGMSSLGIVSVHQGHNFELEFTSDTTARGIWSMTDRLYFPSGSAFSLMTGYGHYLETYEKIDGTGLLETTHITPEIRLRRRWG
ncbi:nuclear transport factor 2 family protein [Phenylobacterium sp. LjRoot225]|uniref:nuclear transport factor 2 family protein n=1 Tax=Phenylobacterium sp. LjRoot225 TaxID=3342285 RepID=UPI003ECE9EDD